MANDYRWVLHLIDRLYGAATDDHLWPGILKDIRQFLGCDGATLFFTDASLKPIGQFFSDNVSNEAINSYKAHYHTVDIRMQRSIPAALNRIVTDRDLVDEDIVRGHEFYQDFLRPIGHRYIVSAAIDLEDGAFAFCSSHLGLQQEHPESDVLKNAALILPHLKRSLQLRRRFSRMNAAGSAALEVLDRLGEAVFLINEAGRITWQNAGATRLLMQRDGLLTSDSELRTHSPAANNDLQLLIRSALGVSDRPRERPGGMMTVTRPSLKRSYQLLVTPLSKTPELNMAFGALTVGPAVAVFVMDLEHEPVPKSEILKSLYNLTPSETRLASALASGTSIKAYAEQTRLSIHYVRWLLKQVEAKTDTRRISDLIRLLARQTGFFSDVLQVKKGKEK